MESTISAGALLSGFALGLSLIVTIGAQNAFVIRQGIRQEHVIPICLTCSISDSILIGSGVLGASYLVEEHSDLIGYLSLIGGVFLIFYSLTHVWSSYSGNHALDVGEGQRSSPKSAIAVCLALTWLNPHVYLETVFLIGAVSVDYSHPWMFGLGASLASFFFFFSIGLFSSYFRSLFKNPFAWRMLDLFAAAVMVFVGGKLLISWFTLT